MAAKVSLHLMFMTDRNKKVRIAIPNPKQPVDPTAVQNAAQLIVEKGVFDLPQGKIVQALPAEQTQTDTQSVS
ncbi:MULTISPECIES: DUF2922 domain-containing protein [Alicyclobacillus]|uniref:DUF2922 domain-containing protein n=1 Tax=Alicyclobacillus sendaiensis PA2 TaxID=3029425 RepID=A0ABT6XZM6_ALISE|nr:MULTISPECIES: DUF2922 domain-containing protein [Alicyclobacillus]MCL6487757.1 DUF2922 domain-containing protein [Alicyclobacillus mali (ex Roth et al. 2021)]MDI9260252.1 DUF2922 domain-containing protein [Alicyclobacillus sendaiensis PA2]